MSLPVGPLDESERLVLRDRVYDALIDLLISGRVTPGQALRIEHLANLLEVSPTPVREALAKIEATGLVTRVAQKGYRVAPLLAEPQMSELIDARELVELGAMELISGELDQLVPQLEAAQQRHEAAARHLAALPPGDPAVMTRQREYFEADWDFHLAILRHSRNRYVLQMAEGLGGHLHRRRQGVVVGVNDTQFAVREHAAILAGFQQGDVQAAIAAMRTHMEQIRRRSLKDLAAQPSR
ncbi:DNA-binding GntR family transcriptional regulator [Kribbella antiqua]|uniref:DNA-binding GntR family transcriptional regulator n=1 Tax=Kribbella antiqua TaxID=2512217 RepID=A0A4V6NNE0_9ACTN|nr:GntR family transcriptional regulator [Kribbella antiqua]TCO40520.1 DNA-binding GntR family transcriptional regulator [Kribbella antiqua]